MVADNGCTESSEVTGGDVSDVIKVESLQPQQQLVSGLSIAVQSPGATR